MQTSTLELPKIGLGTMGIDDPDVIAMALDLGYRHLDTAQIYENEAVVGEGIARSDVPRDEITVATKVWADSLAPEDVTKTTHESATRLGLETIDLLYVHRPIQTYDPEQTLPAFDELVADGTIRAVGVSNFSRQELETAGEILETPIAAHQVEYHPLFQPTELLEAAQEDASQLVAYSPLSAGRVNEVDEVVAVAEKHDVTPATVSLAWLCAKERLVTIPKASSRSHLEANLEAQTLSLDPEDIDRIDGIDREVEIFPE